MHQMRNEIEQEARTAGRFVKAFFQWIVLALVTGSLGGTVGTAFHWAVNWATGLRVSNPWLLWLLPAGGLFIAGLYHLCRMENENTNAIIDSIHFGDKVPLLLVPCIFLSTAVTHLFGGSAGREGAARHRARR